MDPSNRYKEDYFKCQTQEDFENYFLKYAHTKDNPYLEKAKNHIYNKEKLKKENSYGYAVTFGIIGILVFFVTTYKDWEDEILVIISAVCCSPFIIYSLTQIIKIYRLRSRNK